MRHRWRKRNGSCYAHHARIRHEQRFPAEAPTSLTCLGCGHIATNKKKQIPPEREFIIIHPICGANQLKHTETIPRSVQSGSSSLSPAASLSALSWGAKNCNARPCLGLLSPSLRRLGFNVGCGPSVQAMAMSDGWMNSCLFLRRCLIWEESTCRRSGIWGVNEDLKERSPRRPIPP